MSDQEVKEEVKEQTDTPKEGKDSPPKILFVLTYMHGFTGRAGVDPSTRQPIKIENAGEYLLGQITDEDYALWKLHGVRLDLRYPKIVVVATTSNDGQNQIIQSSILPMHFVGKSAQDFVTIDPSWIEILGEIEEQGEGIFICRKHESLYNQYMSAIREWKMELSGLHLPSQADLLNVNSSKQ